MNSLPFLTVGTFHAAADLMSISTEVPTRRALALGLLTEAFRGMFSKLPVGSAVARLIAPIQLGQFEAWFDRATRLIGCATWAQVRPSLSEDLMTQGPAVLRNSDWAGGSDFCLMDFVASEGHGSQVARWLWTKPSGDTTRAFLIREGGPRPGLRTFEYRQLQSYGKRPLCAPWQPTCRFDILATRKASFDRSIGIGFALSALSLTRPSGAESLDRVLTRLGHAQHVGHLLHHVNSVGECDGFITWGVLTDETRKLVSAKGPAALHPSDWDEGETPVIFDRVGTESTIKALLKQLHCVHTN
jgi:hemolysin-activating ACP:hemolysin acyltransferase